MGQGTARVLKNFENMIDNIDTDLMLSLGDYLSLMEEIKEKCDLKIKALLAFIEDSTSDLED